MLKPNKGELREVMIKIKKAEGGQGGNNVTELVIHADSKNINLFFSTTE